jgi:ABC-type multidrug transport system permease subunit
MYTRGKRSDAPDKPNAPRTYHPLVPIIAVGGVLVVLFLGLIAIAFLFGATSAMTVAWYEKLLPLCRQFLHVGG